jgi:hypothetical protein
MAIKNSTHVNSTGKVKSSRGRVSSVHREAWFEICGGPGLRMFQIGGLVRPERVVQMQMIVAIQKFLARTSQATVNEAVKSL